MLKTTKTYMEHENSKNDWAKISFLKNGIEVIRLTLVSRFVLFWDCTSGRSKENVVFIKSLCLRLVLAFT